MSIKDHKWSDDDLSLNSLDIIGGEKKVWLGVDEPFRDIYVISLELSDVKALAAHFELDADHKAALADKEAELEKARELLKAVLDMIKHMNTSPAHAASWAEPNDNALTIGIEDITAYLGDKA